MLSQTAQYALRTALHLAQRNGERLTVAELAEALAVPQNYLSKTLNTLAHAGLVDGTRGKNGGYLLSRPSDRILLVDVVAPFEEVGRRTCLLGKGRCSDRTPCVAHARWKAVATQVLEFFGETTLGDLVAAPAAHNGQTHE